MTAAALFPPMPYADWLARHVLTRPKVAALVTPSARLTYTQIHRLLHAFTWRLADSGVRRGQTIGLCVPSAPLHCILILALNRMGCVSMGVSRPRSPGAALNLPAGVKVDHVLIEQPFTGAPPPGAIDVHFDWLKDKEPLREWQGAAFAHADDPVHIFTSSGTTGTPKAMALSTRLMELRGARNTAGGLMPMSHNRSLSLFGMDIGMGYSRLFASLWPGNTLYLGWPGAAVPELIAHEKIESLIASPQQYQGILASPAIGRADLSSLKLAGVAGSATPAPLIAAIRAHICPRLINGYGSSETAMISFGPLRENHPPGHSGLLVPWVQAQVVNENDNLLPPDAEGILRFRLDGLVPGYLNDAKATAECFRDGWYYPGDTGALSAARILTVLGRVTERLNTGGPKIAPELIENAILAFPGIGECAAFAVPGDLGVEEIWAAIVAPTAIDQKALAAHCAQALGRRAPKKYLLLPTLPRNSAGKIMRGKLRALAGQAAGGGD